MLIVAPRDQQISMGRAFMGGGMAEPVNFRVNGKRVRAFTVAASPVLRVRYAVLVCAERRPALVVAGINLGRTSEAVSRFREQWAPRLKRRVWTVITQTPQGKTLDT